jgi:hypothetical protein
MHSEEIAELLEHLGLKNCVMAQFIFEAGTLASVVAKIEIPADVGRSFIQKMKKYQLKEIIEDNNNSKQNNFADIYAKWVNHDTVTIDGFPCQIANIRNFDHGLGMQSEITLVSKADKLRII